MAGVAATALLVVVGIALNHSLAAYLLTLPVLAVSGLIVVPRRSAWRKWAILGAALLLLPLGLVTWLPAKFKLRVLPPVQFDVPGDQERYSRSRVMEESERIRMLIQTALYDMLRTRRSVWFG